MSGGFGTICVNCHKPPEECKCNDGKSDWKPFAIIISIVLAIALFLEALCRLKH